MSESNGSTRLAYILGVPLADNCERQWPQMNEVVKSRELIAAVEGNFPELTLERLYMNDDVVVVEWSCNYGDGRMFRNVTIGELRNGKPIGSLTVGESQQLLQPGARNAQLNSRLDMPPMVFGSTPIMLSITRSYTTYSIQIFYNFKKKGI